MISDLVWRRTTSMTIVATLCVGCGAQPSVRLDPSPSFNEWIAAIVDDAKGSGASADQIAILERSQAAGEISFEDASAANEATVECLNAAGFTAWTQTDELTPGFPIPGYRASDPSSVSADEAARIEDACSKEHNFYVNYAYQMQPTALEAADAAFERARPAFIQCLEREGVSVAPDATKDELIQAGIEVMDASANKGELVNCWAESGVVN